MNQPAMIDLKTAGVLCIDDDPVIRSVIRYALQRNGCTDVVQANGGGQALEICATRGFDLIICDFQMNPMTGLEFLHAMAAAGHGSGWPIIMLSAETNPATIQEAQDLGVRAWIGKPVSVQTLIERVGTVLPLRGPAGQPAQYPELLGMAERHHARLLTALRSADETIQSLSLRPREVVSLAQSLGHTMNEVRDHARALGYGLIDMLAARAIDLVSAMLRNGEAAMRNHGLASRALGAVLTAMKRVARNRMQGDGAEGGLKLLSVIDGVIAPVRASLSPSPEAALDPR